MEIRLIPVDAGNMGDYEAFEQAFAADLSRYQSRIRPHADSELVRWYYIALGAAPVGSVWLERGQGADYAVLGIFLAAELCRGKGIGRKAIQALLEKDASNMGVKEIRLSVRQDNPRAIACYSGLGFAETRRYQKDNGVAVLEMCLPLTTK